MSVTSTRVYAWLVAVAGLLACTQAGGTWASTRGWREPSQTCWPRNAASSATSSGPPSGGLSFAGCR